MFFKSALLLLSLLTALPAADWLTLQGTEPDTRKADHNPWGFYQLRYQANRGDIIEDAGVHKTPFAMNKPDLSKQETLSLFRARLGLRGRLDGSNRLNYFLLTELGRNGITDPADHRQRNHLTDASLTFRHLPVNIRIGKFKYPGSEESLMSRFVSPFIAFTTVTDQLMMERFIEASVPSGTTYTAPADESVGAFRDSGIELFQRIPLKGNSRITWAYMLGNGSGMAYRNRNEGRLTHYGYLAYERLLGGGKGYFAESLKLFAWCQEGKRAMGMGGSDLYDRTRYGTGLSFYHEGFRFEGEYMAGKGMIYTGAKDIDAAAAREQWAFSIEADEANRADGGYIASVYELLGGFDILARYDRYRRLANDSAKERHFETTTVGVSYRITKGARLDANLAYNDFHAPNNPAAQTVLNAAGTIFRVQLTMVIK